MGHQADSSIGKNLMQYFKNHSSSVSCMISLNFQPPTHNRQLSTVNCQPSTKKGASRKRGPVKEITTSNNYFIYVDAIYMAVL